MLAGDLVVNLDARRNVLSAGGETTPGRRLSIRPRISASRAGETAAWLVSNAEGLRPSSLRVARPELWIYDSELLGSPRPARRLLVWRTEVTSPARPDVRELVLVNAKTGELVLQFSRVAEAKTRQVCDALGSQARVPCHAPYQRQEGGPASATAEVNDAYVRSGVVYDYFKSRFDRDSIDNAGLVLKQTVRYCEGGCPYRNAFWNGQQAVYGPGYASADDVVGHELAHGITERTAGLFSWFQAGAINESLSDVFGELIDHSSATGNDAPEVRWLMGEDLPDGAIRSMSDPTLYDDPDRMTSSLYESGIDPDTGEIVDAGGVHTNSGVNNKAAALMTDGGTFNGRTVTALGPERVAAIYYEVMTNLLTSGSDYVDLYHALGQACQNLVGTHGIAATDCAEVEDAALAVELNAQPAGGAFPAVPDAPVCPSGQVPADLFYDNMEGASNWSAQSMLGPNTWSFTSGYATSGQVALYTPDQTARADAAVVQTQGIAIPAGSSAYLRFDQALDTEIGYDPDIDDFRIVDGGVVEYSIDDGATWVDAEPLMTPADNGYLGPISPTTFTDNPLADRQSYGGATGGFLASRLDLTSLAGSTVTFRFRFATDTNTPPGYFGWLIDDVRLYTCADGVRPGPTGSNALANPGFEWDDDDDARADSWRGSTAALRMPAPHRSGEYSVRLQAADLDDNSTSQRVPAVPFGNYRAGAWVNIPSTALEVSVVVQVQWLNAAGGVVSAQSIRSFTNDTGGAWVNATAVVVAPPGASGARLELDQRRTGYPAYVDDAIVESVADTFEPQTTLTSGAKGTTSSKRARFTFVSNEPGSTFQCKRDRRAWASCASPKTYAGLSKGKHSFRVRAIDHAGNVDRTPAARSWRRR